MMGVSTAAVLGLVLAASSPPRTVMFLPLDVGPGVDATLARAVVSTLAMEAGALQGVKVITAEELGTLLSVEQMRQASGCTQVSCMVEVAGALNADDVVGGSIAQVGQALVLSLFRVDARTSEVKGRSLNTLPPGDDVSRLLRMAPRITAELFRTGQLLEDRRARAMEDPLTLTVLQSPALLAAGGLGLVVALVLVHGLGSVMWAFGFLGDTLNTTLASNVGGASLACLLCAPLCVLPSACGLVAATGVGLLGVFRQFRYALPPWRAAFPVALASTLTALGFGAASLLVGAGLFAGAMLVFAVAGANPSQQKALEDRSGALGSASVVFFGGFVLSVPLVAVGALAAAALGGTHAFQVASEKAAKLEVAEEKVLD